MTTVRRAVPADAEEVMRLRTVMLTSMDPEVPDGPWRAEGVTMARELLAGDTTAAFVVEIPGGLGSCAVGSIERRLPTPANPKGLKGYVYSVATDPSYRRRGFSRACMTTLLEWFAERGVRSIDLRASADGRPLYESLGFSVTRDPAMRILL
jgi:ribosomal protein S18 acetylase RimI-like enzyme